MSEITNEDLAKLEHATQDATNEINTSTRECAVLRLLARDGYNARTLRFMFQYAKTHTVYYHVRGDCAHDHGTIEIEDWDGDSAPQRLSAEDRH